MYMWKRKEMLLKSGRVLGDISLEGVLSFLDEVKDLLWVFSEDNYSLFSCELLNDWRIGISKLLKNRLFESYIGSATLCTKIGENAKRVKRY